MAIEQQNIEDMLTLIRKQYPDWDGFSHPNFVKDEIEYKQATISKARDLLNETELKRLIDENQFNEFIDRLDKIGKDNNLLFLNVPMSGDLNIIYQPELDKATFCREVYNLLYGTGTSETRLERYIEYVEVNHHHCLRHLKISFQVIAGI